MLYSNAVAGREVVVPLAVRQFSGQTSHVSIQRARPGAATKVKMELLSCGRKEPVKTVSFTLSDSTVAAAHYDLYRHPSLAGVPEGFLGAIRITSERPVAAASHVDVGGTGMGVYAFEGVPTSRASSRLYAPLIRREYYGTTGIAVANPGARAVQVRVRYTGSLGTCANREYEQTGRVDPGCSVVFWQGGNTPGTGRNPLPRKCAGAAVIDVLEPHDGKVLAVVNDAQERTAAAYNAASVEHGARRIALPLYRRNHTRAKLSTGIQAMNVGNSAAYSKITFFDSAGREIRGLSKKTEAVIRPLYAHTWYPPDIGGLADGTYGSAIITSDQPLVAIVNDASATGHWDSAIYNGIGADGYEWATSNYVPYLILEPEACAFREP
jgi:hypothetical protein